MTKQEYLLTCLMEEASEIAQAASKTLRFGPHDIHPYENGSTNVERLSHEIMDLIVVFDELRKMIPIPPIENDAYMLYRKTRLEKYLKIARELGRVD